MITLIFLCGCGAGALLGVLLMFCVMVAGTRRATKDTAETIRLMKERNEIAATHGEYLRGLRDWCEHNWERS